MRIQHSPLQILVRIAESCRPGHGPLVSGNRSATPVISPCNQNPSSGAGLGTRIGMPMCVAFPVHPPVESGWSLEQRLYCKTVFAAKIVVLDYILRARCRRCFYLSKDHGMHLHISALQCIGRSLRVDILGGTLSHAGQRVLA